MTPLERFADYADRHPIRARAYVAAAGLAYLWALMGLCGPR